MKQSFVCRRCGETFERNIFPSRNNQVLYCSQECQRTPNRATFICARCGKPFERIHYPSRKAPRYCSQHCKLIATPPKCEYCGKDIAPDKPPSQRGRYGQGRFCSQECSRKAVAKKEKPCLICGKMFIGQKPASKYCSRECRAKSQFIMSDAERTSILETYLAVGPAETSRRLGITKTTIHRIAKQFGRHLDEQTRWNLFRENPTQLELQAMAYLQELGIGYQFQVQIGHYVVDFLLSNNIILETDGDYWHGHSRYEPLTERQQKQQSMDKSRNTYFKERGYVVIRVWESDLELSFLRDVLSRYCF